VASLTALLAALSGAFLAYLFCGSPERGARRGQARFGRSPGGGARFGRLLAQVYVLLPYLAAASFVASAYSDNGLLAHGLKLLFPGLKSLGIRYHASGLGVILTCLYKQFPFVFLSLWGVFRNLREKFEETARTLGAGSFAVFRRIYLPLAFRPLAGVWILLFQFSLFNYEAFAFLGPSAPKGLGELLVMLYYSADREEKVLAMTLCALEFMVSCGFAALLGLLMFFRRRKG
jgi:ABC-type sulfate transport system permease component